MRGAALIIVVGLGLGGLARSSSAPPPDALTRRTTGELAAFVDWLEQHDVEGYVGEVGWPNEGPWGDVAERWFRLADDANLWVTSWLTTEGWGLHHPLSPYASPLPSQPVKVVRRPAEVLEAHPTTDEYLRGVNFSGGEHGFPHIESRSLQSNVERGVYGYHYRYGSEATYAFLASRGVEVVRLPFRWERVQPTLLAPLDPERVGELKAAVRRIGRHGMRVILDLHNFGGYYAHDPLTGGGRRLALGTGDLPPAAFADLWRRLAIAFADDETVLAYDLMNEPSHLGRWGPSLWERSSSQAVEAVRAIGDDRLIMVAGYDWSALHNWARAHPRPWIDDPAGNIRYEAHHYWDSRHSSQYGSYEAELRAAAAGDSA